MAKQRRPKLVVIEEGLQTADVASSQVAPAIGKAAEVIDDAVTAMAGSLEPDESTVLSNDDFGIIEASLTDSEAEAVAGKAGVVSVEDDEEMFALDGDMDIEPVADEEAAAEIDVDLRYDEADEAGAAEQLAVRATFHAQTDPALDEAVDFDEAGHVLSLDDPTGFAEATGDEALLRVARAAEATGDDSVQALRDYITCGLKRIYTEYAWRYSTGYGVRVAVVDTGVTPRHPDLRVWGGASYVPGVTPWFDDQGHGTHVAGTIAATANNLGLVGVAPHSRIYAVKVLNRSGQGYTSWILNGLAWCARTGMHVVNLSLGGGANTHDPRVYSAAYERAGRVLRSRGILAVAAAGNSGQTANPYVGNPARCPSFMAVAAVDCNLRRASFSSYGPQVEISAPGVSVWSTYPPNGFKQLSGTSMATPHVAGVAALVKRRRPSWHGDTTRVHLWRTAQDLGTPGRDPFFGYGLVNAYRAVR